MHGNAAEQVGVDWIKAPPAGEQIHHAIGGIVCGCGCVGGRLYYDPCGGGGVVCGRGFYEWTGERLVLVEMEAEGDIGGTLNTVDAHFPVALCGMRVAAGEEGAGLQDG